ncbi:GTP diphosphokinase [Lentibacillus sp. JNUCC-1]|uniref:HD domain-containing protein n=1 Tax=Lentibacillus sp. JNUCC-1 TaxID=2654513 RepID=UPI0012E91349|nr:HD domain-containing protein [Lentibacillus sp. JNUCC-1]MUV38427.1 GTP diphosphokinase [Lentibacillus sp. JNUCC-1]
MKAHAKAFAAKAHDGQTRKSSAEPYITHPIRVAERLEASGCSEEVICAGYLHDVVEDTLVEIEDITEHFGEHIAQIVAAHTEDKSKSWHERKQHTIDTIRTASKEVKYLIVADKLDNLLELEKELSEQGDNVWRHFNAGFDEQKWYNESIAMNMEKGLASEDRPGFFHDFQKAVKRVFGE